MIRVGATRLRHLLIIAFVHACSPAQPRPHDVVTNAQPAPPRAARWILDAPGVATCEVDLGGGALLTVGDGGERFIKRGDAYEGAELLLPEPVAGVQRVTDGFRFVGESGAAYTSRDPLGPFTRTSEANIATRKVAAGKAAIVVTRTDGSMARSTDGGKTFANIDLSKWTGAAVDVAMKDEIGVALLIPQTILMTKDDGATWSPVPSPNKGVRSASVTRDGVAIMTDRDPYKLDPATSSFVPMANESRAGIFSRRKRVLEGDHVLEIELRADGWAVGWGAFGTLVPLTHVAALDGCKEVDGAAFGTTIHLACFEAFEKKHRVRILRSEDGATFTPDGELPLDLDAIPIDAYADPAIASGPNGWLYINRRCTGADRCANGHVRAATGAPFTEVTGEHRVFSHTKDRIVSIGDGGDGGHIYEWKPGTAMPVELAVLGELPFRDTSIHIDADGTIRGVGTSSGAFVFRKTLSKITLPEGVFRASFAGKRGLATTYTRAFETDDEGRTWFEVASPHGNDVIACTENGCVMRAGHRVGWDGQSSVAPRPGLPALPTQVKQLACNAKDAWIPLGRGQLPGAEAVGHGSSRFITPVRDDDGKLFIAVNQRRDAPTKINRVPLLGPAAKMPQYGVSTDAYVQPGGAVAVRYTFARTKDAALSPVTADLAWYRDSGSVHTAKISLTPLRITRDGKKQRRTHATTSDVASLGADRVYFHEPPHDVVTWVKSKDGAMMRRFEKYPLYVLKDDGSQEKIDFDDSSGEDSRVVMLGKERAIVGFEHDHWESVTADGKRNVWFPLLGHTEERGGGSLATSGDNAYLVVTSRGYDSPLGSWLVPLQNSAELTGALRIPTSIDSVPTCKTDKALPLAFVEPYVRGGRMPVTVSLDGRPFVTSTHDVAMQITPGKSDACVVAWSTLEEDEDYSVLIFADDPAHAVLFKAEADDEWPRRLSMRALECASKVADVPADLKHELGF